MIPITKNTPPKQLDRDSPPHTPPPNLILTVREVSSNAIQTSTKEELAQYYHQCLLSPLKTTVLQALNNQPFKTFPGLTYKLISRHLRSSTETYKEHMKHHKQNIFSTRNNKQAIKNAQFEVCDKNPPQQICSALDMFYFAALVDATENTMYTDLTGKFPVRSYKNNQYVFVAHF